MAQTKEDAMVRKIIILALLGMIVALPAFAQESNTSVRFELDELQAQVTSLNEQVSRLNGFVDVNVMRIESLELEVSNLDTQMGDLESQVVNLDFQLTEHLQQWNTFKDNWDLFTLALNSLISNVQRLLGPGPGANLVGKTYAEIFGENPPSSYEIDLRGANLTDADLTGADLKGANLMGATLIGANLTNADLTGGNFTYCDLSGVTWDNTVCPDGLNSDNQGLTCANNLVISP